MEINRSNYEIWIIDLLDGNLNDIEAEQVKLFLVRNPDLKEEFNELASFNLGPSGESFRQKEQLKKSTSDLNESQFEYLCTAYLENDLSVAWQSGLKEIIDNNPNRRRTFELIQKTKLVPPVTVYKHKNLLIRKTLLNKVVRFSVIGLTTAATIGLLVISYPAVQGLLTRKTFTSSQNIPADSNLLKPYFEINPGKAIKAAIPADIKNEYKVSQVKTYTSAMLTPDTAALKQKENSLRNDGSNFIQPAMLPVIEDIALEKITTSNTLVASNVTLNLPPDDDGMSNIGRFISKTFREKILREKVSKNRPLKGYEIAEAGVTGLNKLLGWKMALNEKNDENGELKSVYFSSKILNFNAPVKKSVPRP